ncbi:1-acyl-sn-glycerol-3-phosphate acyltransferase [Deinococcus malanensis]|uniref:1-acyl-sn-glycerol-3-phosphate acyltransferase n=1 Tax=Deinococcus malanensis TaxID=1706855 RepID=UPI00363D1E7F
MRSLARDAGAGYWIGVFPEGAIQAAGPLQALQPGAGWLAQIARVPLVPVAIRVVVRAGPGPEAFLRFGTPCLTSELPSQLAAVLQALDADLSSADPERPPAGYLLRVTGLGARPDEVTLAVRWLTRLSGFGRTEAAPELPVPAHGRMRP